MLSPETPPASRSDRKRAPAAPGPAVVEAPGLSEVTAPGQANPPRAHGAHIPVEVDHELAIHLAHLAQARGMPMESLTIELLRAGLEQDERRQLAEKALAGLTPRQREVVRLATGGRTNRQIARELWLSPETVKTHLRRALEHFDLHSKAELRLMLHPLDGDPPRDPLQGAKRD